MKHSLLIYLTFIIGCLSVQKTTPKEISVDSLKKYSYLVYSHTPNFNYSATGFFIKIKKDYYLISARHVFTGWNSIKHTIDNDYPDTIYVSLCDNCSPENQLSIPIDISKVKKNDKHLSIFEEPDFYIYKITKGKKISLNSIEGFMPNYSKIDIKIIDSVLMYGFPENYNYFDLSKNITKNTPLLATGTIDFPLEESLTWTDSNSKDSFHYLAKADSASNFGEGYSGAPVFFKMKNKLLFGGICAAGSHKSASFLMVKPTYIRDSILSLIKKPF